MHYYYHHYQSDRARGLFTTNIPQELSKIGELLESGELTATQRHILERRKAKLLTRYNNNDVRYLAGVTNGGGIPEHKQWLYGMLSGVEELRKLTKYSNTGTNVRASDFHPLYPQIIAMGIRLATIADIYGCSKQFVWQVMVGKTPCPDSLSFAINQLFIAIDSQQPINTHQLRSVVNNHKRQSALNNNQLLDVEEWG